MGEPHDSKKQVWEFEKHYAKNKNQKKMKMKEKTKGKKKRKMVNTLNGKVWWDPKDWKE